MAFIQTVEIRPSLVLFHSFAKAGMEQAENEEHSRVDGMIPSFAEGIDNEAKVL